jgi:hypothetical protein
MVDTSRPLPEQLAAIRNRTDWLVGAGYDFISTEVRQSHVTQSLQR